MLRYNFIFINIDGTWPQWKRYVSELLIDQIDFSSGFASSPPVQDDLEIIIRDINDLKKNRVSNNFVFDAKINCAIDFINYKLIYYCGFSRSISLSYLINQALLRTGRGLLLHCAALEDKHGNGYVYSALGGVGKTQLALSAVSKGAFKLLGDDLVICSADAHLFPYLRPLCLYSYHYSILSLDLPKHYFIGPDFIYKIIRRLSHFTLRYFGTKKWFATMRSVYTSRSLSNDISPSLLFRQNQLSSGNIKFDKLYAVTIEPSSEKFNKDSFTDFVFNTTMPEWVYFDRLTELFWRSKRTEYGDAMHSMISTVLKHLKYSNMTQVTKKDLEGIYG